jgi:hypothetical protein
MDFTIEKLNECFGTAKQSFLVKEKILFSVLFVSTKLIGKVALDNIDFFVFHMYNDVETYFGQL